MDIQFDISEDELPIFLAEVAEHLQVLDESLVEIERTEGNPDLLQKLFRAAHTLKGMAGMIGHLRMTRLMHAMETAFDCLRKSTLQISTPLVDLCLDTVDGLRSLCAEVNTGKVSNVDVDQLAQEFNGYISAEPPPAQPLPKKRSPGLVTSHPTALQQITGAPNGKKTYLFSARIAQNSVASSARAFQIIMALQELGDLSAVSPSLEQIELAQPVQSFFAELTTAATREAIENAIGLISEVEMDALVDKNQTETEEPAPSQSDTPPKARNDRSDKPVERAPDKPQTGAGSEDNRKGSPRAEMAVRTSVERLDNLMNLVGELITDRNHLYQIRTRLESDATANNHIDLLSETVSHLSRITDQLQEEVMQIRMLPISNVFNKFPRMVRDMAQKTGKQIDLVVHGEDTQLDRSMIEEINDPLIHLVRNSLDHGIETPADRRTAGKPERGTVTMTARHEQGRIMLTIEDDGSGIDPNKIRRSAVQKGLISEEEANNLSDEQAIDLIFMPGLSTAQKVTDISGRGVGMDIVHTNIQKVSGTVQVESVLGKGTVFTVTLPLTLAIVPTLLVQVAQSIYAIPIVMVTETLRMEKSDIYTVRGKPVTLLRNNVLPLLSLTEVFGHCQKDIERKHIYAVVVHSGKQRVGLIVDSLTGEEEVVVKSLGSLVGEIPGVSSAAILGDGSIALIVDVPDLFKMAGIH